MICIISDSLLRALTTRWPALYGRDNPGVSGSLFLRKRADGVVDNPHHRRDAERGENTTA